MTHLIYYTQARTIVFQFFIGGQINKFICCLVWIKTKLVVFY